MAPSSNLHYQKAAAIRSFQTKPFLQNIFRFFNLSAALFFFHRSSCFPLAVEAFRHAYHRLLPLFNNSFYVFLLLNALILLLYTLSSDTKTTASFSPLEFESRVTVRVDSEFQLSRPIFEETVTAVTQTQTTTCCTTVTTNNNGEKVVSEKKCYRRVQSESFVVAPPRPRREFKRFNTGLEKRLSYVEELSKEEFNRAVEDFIAKHKRMQWEEQLESHSHSHTTTDQSLAIIPQKQTYFKLC